jgi:hypothetical protein
MPLFNASLLTGSLPQHAIIQFGCQADGSGSGVQGTIFRSFLETSTISPSTSSLLGPGNQSLLTKGDNAILYDPNNIVNAISMNWVQTQSGPNYIYALTEMQFNLNAGGPWRITLIKQYSSYGSNTQHVYLSTVSGGILVDLVMDLYYESGFADSAGDREITPLQTSAEFTGSGITVALQKHYLADSFANCEGTCRFKIEQV